MLKLNKLLQTIVLSFFFSFLAAYANSSLVEQIDDDFYMGLMKSQAGTNLWLVMERITPDNLGLWRQYIKVQNNLRAVQFAYPSSKGSPTDGSSHFSLVLDDVSLTKNEVWAAYITKADFPLRIAQGLSPYYSVEISVNKSDPFAKDIEMFVTVTSSEQALITSHMGIASTLEGATTRQKGTSLDLHSFAAKVMLMRNPDRRFMINAPVFAMEQIIINALPDATFVGTREMRKRMQESLGVGFREFSSLNKEKCKNALLEKANREAVSRNKYLQSEINQLHNGKRPGETIDSMRQYLFDTLPFYSLIELNSEGLFVPCNKKIEDVLPNEIKSQFFCFKNPYSFPPAPSREQVSIPFLEFMEKYPPILSIPQKDHLVIYEPQDPQTPWLTIDESNWQTYNWISTRPFKPAGITHFIAVDLVALADSKPLLEIEKDLGFSTAIGEPYSVTISSKDFYDAEGRFIEALKNNALVVNLTIDNNINLGDNIAFKNYQNLFLEGFQNKPNLKYLTIEGSVDANLLFESSGCIGNKGTPPQTFIERPHLQFFAHLRSLHIKGTIFGSNRNDAYFLIDFVGYLNQSKQLKSFAHTDR